MATTILLLRHAEKPEEGGEEAGVDAFGRRDKRGLTPRGWQRAGALVRWIVPATPGAPAPIALPAAIFSASPNADSMRPVLTMQPLAETLGLRIRARFAGGETTKLLKAVAKVEGTVLLCWRHKFMGDIAQALCPQLQPKPEWRDDVFDRAWLFTRERGRWQLHELVQNLLPGDTQKLLRRRN
jgi:broad specificity phosphatase PhoE